MRHPNPTIVAYLLPFALTAFTGRCEASNARSDWINRLQTVAKGVTNYREDAGHAPADMRDANGKRLLSWRVAILPYIEHQELYKKFHLDEPWDSPHNRGLIPEMPRDYACWWDDHREGYTPLLAVVDGPPGSAGLRDLGPDRATTVLLAEADDEHAVVWSEPRDLRYDPADPAGRLGRRFGAGFFHDRGAFAAFADGTVRFLPDSADPALLRSVLGPAPDAPARLEVPWPAAVAEPALRGLLVPPLVFAIVTITGAAVVGRRLRAGRPTCPGERLWVLVGAMSLAHLLGVAALYRYEPFPRLWGDGSLVFWFLPAATAAVVSYILAAVWGSTGGKGWVFFASGAVFGFNALDTTVAHQYRTPEEAFVTGYCPLTLALVGGLTLMTATPPPIASRRLANASGLAVTFAPLVWFLTWTAAGVVSYHPLLQRTRD